MARMRPIDVDTKAVAALRRRGKGEVKRLQADLKKTADPVRQEALRDQISDIQTYMRNTYLRGRGRGAGAQLLVRNSAENLRRLIGAPMKRGTKRAEAEAARAERLFAENLRKQRRGEGAALFTGARRMADQEGIFYAATQSIWMGGNPLDRDKEIMEALGASSLEEAYDIVMSQNAEALEVSAAGGVASGATKPGSDPWIAYVNFVD